MVDLTTSRENCDPWIDCVYSSAFFTPPVTPGVVRMSNENVAIRMEQQIGDLVADFRYKLEE
jgi:hypothetical protein